MCLPGSVSFCRSDGDHIRPEVVERRQQFEHEAVQGRRSRRLAAPGDVGERGSGSGQRCRGDGWRGRRGSLRSCLTERGRARILLVEDHDEVREFIGTLLWPHYELLVAENGREAWDLVRAESPDRVVSDVMMPEMSGTDLARAIKSDPALRATPVILLTARVGSEATLEAYAHGADDFVAKPFHPRVLMARIRAQLRLRALGLQLAQQEKLAAVGTLAAGILHEVRNPVNAILNAARVLSGGRSKPEMTRQLIQIIADGAQRIEGITTALDSHARPAEAGVTHSCDIREGLDADVHPPRTSLGGRDRAPGVRNRPPGAGAGGTDQPGAAQPDRQRDPGGSCYPLAPRGGRWRHPAG